MKKTIFFFLLVLSAVLILPRQSDASGFSLGQTQTISSNGSLDVLRNPAMMAFQTGTNTIGFIFYSTAYNENVHSYGLNNQKAVSSVLVHSGKYTTGSMYLSYSHKVDQGAVGIAVDSDDPHQVEYNRYDKRYSSSDGINIGEGLLYGSYIKKSPRFVLSYGRIISGNHAVGFQVSAGYSRLDDTYGFSGVWNFAVTQRHHVSKKIEEFNGQLSVGYQYRDEDSQAGIIIRSGRFNWIKTKIYYAYRDFSLSSLYSGSVKEPFHMEYDRGFSITAGGYRKLASFIAVGLEGEYVIPYNYSEKGLRLDEFTSFYGTTVNSDVTKKGVYSIRGGIEILPSGPVTLNLGGRMSTGGEKRKSKYFHESVTIDTYTGLFGLDFKFTDYMLIMVGSQLEYTRERRDIGSTIVMGNSIDGLTLRYNLDSYLGMSFQF